MQNNNSDEGNTLESALDRIRTISSTILSVGFVLYTIGYLMTNSNLSRYGAHEIGLLEPSYLVSGFLFLFFWLVPIFVPALMIVVFWSSPIKGIDNYQVVRVKSVMELTLFYVEVSLFYLGLLAAVIWLLYPIVERNGEDRYILPIDILWFILIQLGSLCLLFIGIFNKPYKNLYDLISKRWKFLSIVSILSMTLFMRIVFPTIPAVYGGGKTQTVCLALTDETAYRLMLSQININLSENNWTEPIDLLFEGENSLTILLQNKSTARISKELIASIRYNCIDSSVP